MSDNPRELLWQGTDPTTGGKFRLSFVVEKPLDPPLFDIAEKLLSLARDGMTEAPVKAFVVEQPTGAVGSNDA